MLYSQLCNKYSDKSNRWNLGLSLSVASSAVGAIISSLSLATLLITIHQVQWISFSKSTVAHTTRGSAMAERLRNAHVSRNSATKKHPIWKLEFPGLSCGIICVILRLAVFTQYRSVTDTHTHRQTDGRTDTALRCAVKIDHIALHTKYNYQATSVGW